MKPKNYIPLTLVCIGLLGCLLNVRSDFRRLSKPTGALTILYTSELRGRTEPVFTGDGRQAGGMAWIAGLAADARDQRGTQNVILIDVGGSMTLGQRDITRHMNSARYDFAVPGKNELALGARRLELLAHKANFALSAANLNDEFKNPVLAPYHIRTLGNCRVAFIGIAGSAHAADLRIADVLESCKQLVPALQKQSDLIVVVSQAEHSQNRAIAREIEGIDLVISGGWPRFAISQIGKTWLIETGTDGKAIGEVTLIVEKGRITDVLGGTHVLWHDLYLPDRRMERELKLAGAEDGSTYR